MPIVYTIGIGILILILLFSAVRYRDKTKQMMQVLGKIGIRLCIAALGLYLLNWTVEFFDVDFRLAINPITVGVVAVLGVPGVISLAVIKYLMK